MKIDELIANLQRVRAASGNVDVAVTSFCGTNSGHVLFDFEPPARKKFSVKRHMNGLGQFCLHVKLSEQSRKEITEGVAEMQSRGYRYFRSQYLSLGESPRAGLSPCEWHTLW
jgi:hypothetical protein